MTATSSETRAVEEVVRFGPFTLQPVQRVLVEGDTPIQLGSRAFDILLLLLEQPGSFVANEDILRRVWPTTVVVEGNLRVHVTALRKALGDGRDGRRYVVNVPNRGYSFVAPVWRSRAGEPPTIANPPAQSATASLTAPLHRIIGREAAIESIGDQLCRHRLVTIVGPGGIGKTTVALSVAAAVTAKPAQGRWNGLHVVDLAPLSDPRLVSGALAAVLGLTTATDDVTPNILAFLQDKSLLLLLDNCEHVLAAVAELAEAVLRSAPGVHILATSREPLKADGERVVRLQPLAQPAEGSRITAAEALRFGAVELFVDRATAALDTFAFQDADVQTVVDICRGLDGIPLAIELAAACVPSLGIHDLQAALGSRFCQISAGRRTAVPRHKTLHAVLDWSYGLLSPRERAVLARLSMFRGSFTLESAGALAADPSMAPGDVFGTVTDLAAKSLLSVDASGDRAYFRLLFSTRLYASRRLAEMGEVPALRRRHAEHVLDLLQASEVDWRDAASPARWRDRYERHVDDVRKALRWAMSADGDVQLGIAITVRSSLLLFRVARIDECMRHVLAAMDALARPGAVVDQQLKFELLLVHGFMGYHTWYPHPAQRSFELALDMAEQQEDRRQLALALSSNFAGAFIRADSHAMLAFAQRYAAVTEGDRDPAASDLYYRMKAWSLHFFGDQRRARMHVERSLAVPEVDRPPFLSAMLDRELTMGTLLTRVLWLQGFPEQAEEIAARAVECARREGGRVALAFVLGLAACPVALWTGRFDLARERVSLLLRHSAEHSLVPWRHFALDFDALLAWHESGRRDEPLPASRVDIGQRPPQVGELLATLHPALADDSTLLRGDRGDAGWCHAELLRVRGERARGQDRSAAEALYLQSLERARQDGALAWELRGATSLGRLWLEQGRMQQALQLVQSVLDRLTEGQATPDVREAVALREALGAAIASPPCPGGSSRTKAIGAFPAQGRVTPDLAQ